MVLLGLNELSLEIQEFNCHGPDRLTITGQKPEMAELIATQ
jgi:hypothetical protein